MRSWHPKTMSCAFLAGIGLATGVPAVIDWARPGPARAATARSYAVYAISEDGQQLAPGIDGNILLNATGLQMALNDISQKGYRLHSVVCNGEVGGYLVVMEE